MYVFCNRHSVHSKYLISFPAKRGLALPEDVMLMDLDFGALALVTLVQGVPSQNVFFKRAKNVRKSICR